MSLTSRRMRVAAVAAAALLGCLTFAPPSPAAPAWLAPVTVSSPTDRPLDVHDLVVLPDGTTIVGYVREDHTPCPCVSHAEVTVRPPGGTFGPPKMLSTPANRVGEDSVRLASDPDGNVTAVWTERMGANYFVRSAVRPAGGDFGAPTEVSGGGADALRPDIAVGGGIAVATWLRGTHPDLIVQAAVRPAGSDFFQSASDLSGTGARSYMWDEQPPALAVAPNGAAIVAWDRFDGTNHRIEASARPASGGPFTLLPPVFTDNGPAGEHAHMPHVAMDSIGRATIAFSTLRRDTAPEPDQFRHIVVSAFRDVNGSFNPIDDVSNPAVDSASAGWMSLALSRDNQALLVWNANKMEAAARASNTSFGAIQEISAPGTFTGNPAVRFDGAGNAVAVWQLVSGTRGAIQSSARPRGGQFGDVTDIETLETPGELIGPTPLELDPAGNGATAYVLENTAGKRVARVAGFDGAAPQQRAVNIPATATAGRPAAMSVSAFDVWSAFSTTWSFGDGTSATGDAVQHTFPAPGAYTVTATTTDAVGSVTSTSRAVEVAPADADGDGSPVGQDCNDTNPGIGPGAVDIPGNGVDENCDGTDAKVRIASGFGYSWKAFRRYTTVKAMSVTEVPAGAKVAVRCKGRGCPFKVKRKTFKKSARTYDVAKLFNRRGKRKKVARLRPRTRIEIRVTKANHIGRIATWVVRSRKIPTFKSGCLSVDGKKIAC